MSRKQELQEQIAALRDELWEIEDAEKRDDFSKLDGKYFVYSNSYGGARWPLYQRVIRRGDDYYKIQAQLTERGEAQFVCEKLWRPDTSTIGKPTTEDAYNTGVAHCLGAAKKILQGVPMDSDQTKA